MLWIIQEDLYSENRRNDLRNVLQRLDIDFISVNVNKNIIISEKPINENQPIITNGSIMLSNIAKERDWKPGSFLNDNFSYDIWATHYQNFILNKDAIISSLADAKVFRDNIFVRPILDNKSFNGKVFTKEEFLQFQQDSINLKHGFPKPDIQILVSTPKKIGQEHRHYIVDGKVITSSRYKLSGQPNFSEGADEMIIDTVEKAIKFWQPARAFVLDTYISGEEVGIVEIGCICHAGLYKADLMKLVNALDSMIF